MELTEGSKSEQGVNFWIRVTCEQKTETKHTLKKNKKHVDYKLVQITQWELGSSNSQPQQCNIWGVIRSVVCAWLMVNLCVTWWLFFLLSFSAGDQKSLLFACWNGYSSEHWEKCQSQVGIMCVWAFFGGWGVCEQGPGGGSVGYFGLACVMKANVCRLQVWVRHSAPCRGQIQRGSHGEFLPQWDMQIPLPGKIHPKVVIDLWQNLSDLCYIMQFRMLYFHDWMDWSVVGLSSLINYSVGVEQKQIITVCTIIICTFILITSIVTLGSQSCSVMMYVRLLECFPTWIECRLCFKKRGAFSLWLGSFECLWTQQLKTRTKARWPRRGALGLILFKPGSGLFAVKTQPTQQLEQIAFTCAVW